MRPTKLRTTRRRTLTVVGGDRWLILVTGFLLACLHNCELASGSDESRGGGAKRAECQTWSSLENKTLPLQNQGHAECVTNDECTGFSCQGLYQGKKLRFGMRVIPCENPPGVEIFGSAPQFNAKNFSHVFYHKAEYEVPGALLNFSMLPQGSVVPTAGSLINGRLEVQLKMNHDTNTLSLGLTAKACINSTCISSKPLFNNTEIPVPDCPNAIPANDENNVKAYSQCRMSDVSPCGNNQVCEQSETGSFFGTCACLPGYSLQDDKTCISIAEEEFKLGKIEEVNRLKKSTKSVTQQLPAFSVPQESPDAKGSSALTAIAVSLVAIMVVVGLGLGIVMRTRMGTRIRALMTSTPYGGMANGDQGQMMGSTTTLESESPNRNVLA